MVCVNSELKRLVPICYSSEKTKYIVLASSVLKVIGPDEQTGIDDAHKDTTTQAQKGAGSFHIHRKIMKELGILAVLGVREQPNLAGNLVTHRL